jgi:RecA-family ATPase
LFYAAEDDANELHRRLAAIVTSENLTWERLEGLKLLPLADQDAVLGKADGRASIKATNLFELVEGAAREWEAGLIVLDALHNIFAGDENDRAQAVQFVSLLRGLAARCTTSIIVLAHPSLFGMSSGQGTSGSTGWSNAARSRLYLSRPEADKSATADPDVRTLRVKKANYGPTTLEISVRWVDGVFVRDTEAAPPLHYGEAAQRADDEFLRMLDLYTDEGRSLSDKPSAQNNAAKVFSDDTRCQFRGKVGRQVLKDAMNRLFGTGRIKAELQGPRSRQTTRLVRCHTPSNPVQTSFRPPVHAHPHTPCVQAPAENGRARIESEAEIEL